MHSLSTTGCHECFRENPEMARKLVRIEDKSAMIAYADFLLVPAQRS